ncbi:hypothetical protein YW3DRAFT_02760 [Streptomyces sp. MnatMP-M77]|nr:hypothetical protein SACT1_5626 [Streptomyces sp. ACT-1]SBV06755.1 hypothetical protein YW3DRAFT_02760 [Streptomyces sp. MnatMP-M77]SCE44643.1 hypothetical protein GA0115261_105546 [Streptomyces sp. OspMP-M43]
MGEIGLNAAMAGHPAYRSSRSAVTTLPAPR